MTMRLHLNALIAVTLAMAATTPLRAMPTQVSHIETPQCDVLFIPQHVDELGDAAIFPTDEAILHQDLGLANPVCLPTDNPSLIDFLVSATNLTGRDLSEVWYIADPETTITNFDGEANNFNDPPVQEAFRIDRFLSDPLGTHHPLVFESGLQDGIWQNGEEWRFVLQDYTNTLGLPPDAFTSIGVGSASVDLAGTVGSSGSLVTRLVPEPGSLALALLGLTGLAFFLRQRTRHGP